MHVTYSPLLDYQEGDLIAKKSLYLGALAQMDNIFPAAFLI